MVIGILYKKLTYEIAKISNLSPKTIIVSGFSNLKSAENFFIKLNAILLLFELEVVPI